MLDRNALELLMNRMQKVIRKADPELARVLVVERSHDPDDPRGFKYLDGLVLALSDVTAHRDAVGRRIWRSLLRTVRMIPLEEGEEPK